MRTSTPIPIYIMYGSCCDSFASQWTGLRTELAIRRHLKKLRRPSCGWAYAWMNGRRVDDDRLASALKKAVRR